MNTSLQLFSFKGQEIRTILIDGEPWWVASDVCQVLGIARVDSALRALDDDEKGAHTVSTPGGMQKVSIINEPGLYGIVLVSRKPEAKEFKRWLKHDVIPSIRKTGGYSASQGRSHPQFNFKYQERLSLNKNVRVYGYIPATKFLDDINIQFLEDVIVLSETSSPDISIGKFLAKRLPSEPWYDASVVRKPVGGTDRSKWDQDIIMTVYVTDDGYPVKREVTHFPIEWYAPIWHIIQTEYFPDLFPKYLAGKHNGIIRCGDEKLRKYIAERVNYFSDEDHK